MKSAVKIMKIIAKKMIAALKSKSAKEIFQLTKNPMQIDLRG
jgi:hypothetical protein